MAARRLDIDRPINHRDIERRITPQDRAAAPPAEIVGGVIVYTLAIRGNAASGTIAWSATVGATTETGTFNFDDDPSDVVTALTTFDAGVKARGGSLQWNVIKIRFTDDTYTLRITSTSLVREEYGVIPKAEVSQCVEPDVGWGL